MRPANAFAEGDQRTDVLLVDDDRIALLFLTKVLEKAHFQVTSVESPNEALRQLARLRPGVIVADVNMPEMSGFEFYQKVREMGHSDIPFLFCSGKGRPSDRIQGLRIGADDYLSKPIEAEELVLKVRRQITSNQSARALRMALERTDSQLIMNGHFGGITVADVLQTVMALGQGNYCLRLNTSDDGGTIYLTDGSLVHAETGWLSGEKAFSRMLGWSSGTFVIENRRCGCEPSLSGRLDHQLLEKLTLLNEYQLRRAELAEQGESFEVEMGAIRRPLDEQAATMMMLVEQHRSLEATLTASPLTDLETVSALLRLLREGVIRPA
ncbi:MAG TPA: response regulator [Blastocatellia bacterium]|nr:response regulator [Blastocatellia bacterium]